ncbi:MAG: phospholipase D-like domain-containing protein, partial [Asgard group archaeon]|nr:phospholipase D-like domain-containing protein [Asgard group archaeon]
MIIRNKIAVVIFLLMLFPITYTSETNEAFVKNDTEISSERNFGEQIRGKQPYTGTIPTTCFVGPDSAYQVVMDSLNNAIWSFYLEVYTLSSQPLVNALIDAVNRGVDVQVSLSHDRVNPYEDNYTLEAAYRLDQAGILVTWCSSSFAYTHAKFWIVDSETAYIYSGNWAPSSIPQYSQAYENREMGLAFQNTDIATYFENLFFDDQAIGNPYAGTEPHNGELQDNTTSGSYSPQFFEESFNEYTEVLPVISPDNSYTEIHSLLESANVSINVELQYIKFDCEFLDDLLAAAQRGVSIKVLIPEPGSTNENVTETLLSYGIEVRFFAGLKHNHNKYINVDGEIVCISSINWSNNSVVNNREAGAIVKNTNIANYFSEVFNYDWGKAELPSGLLPVSFVDPKIGGIISDEDTIQVSFSGYNYTQAEFFINNSLVHTWINPSGIESFHIDTTSFSNGIHTMKVVGDVESATDITIQGRVNIIDTTELGVV